MEFKEKNSIEEFGSSRYKMRIIRDKWDNEDPCQLSLMFQKSPKR
jgi:hypothetical protein